VPARWRELWHTDRQIDRHRWPARYTLAKHAECSIWREMYIDLQLNRNSKLAGSNNAYCLCFGMHARWRELWQTDRQIDRQRQLARYTIAKHAECSIWRETYIDLQLNRNRKLTGSNIAYWLCFCVHARWRELWQTDRQIDRQRQPARYTIAKHADCSIRLQMYIALQLNRSSKLAGSNNAYWVMYLCARQMVRIVTYRQTDRQTSVTGYIHNS